VLCPKHFLTPLAGQLSSSMRNVLLLALLACQGACIQASRNDAAHRLAEVNQVGVQDEASPLRALALLLVSLSPTAALAGPLFQRAPSSLGLSAGSVKPLQTVGQQSFGNVALVAQRKNWRSRNAVIRAQSDAALESAASFDSAFVKLGGVRHHIRDTGEVDPNGPIVVLMHGFAGSTESWDQVGPLLGAGGCRAIAIDRVGFGRTDRPMVPTLPPPPRLPFGDAVAERLESLTDAPEEQGPNRTSNLFPDPWKALAMAFRTPETLTPRLPWEFSELREDPYSARFAVSRALWDLLRKRIDQPMSGVTRPIYLVAHSAGGPLALRALVECASKSPLPRGTALAGIALVAPAALDPREDPDIYDASSAPGVFADLPLPADLRRRAELEARIALFRTAVALPDAFGLQIARSIAEGRDLEEAVRGQMHPRMSAPEFAPRVSELAEKYARPILEFPDQWDKALLNVYRADAGQEGLRGRSLLAAARAAKQKLGGVRVLVTTGDDDRLVPSRGSKRVAELLEAERFEEIQETGHLPMDERPEELVALLLDFIGRKSGDA